MFYLQVFGEVFTFLISLKSFFIVKMLIFEVEAVEVSLLPLVFRRFRDLRRSSCASEACGSPLLCIRASLARLRTFWERNKKRRRFNCGKPGK